MSLLLAEGPIAMTDEERGEDFDRTERVQRQGYGRREGDKGPSDWQKPGFWLSALGFLLTIALVLLSSIWNKVSSIEAGIAALNVDSGKQAAKLEFQQVQVNEVKARADMLEARIIVLEKANARLEAERSKP